MKMFSRRLTLSLAAVAMFSVGCGATQEDTQPQVELTEEEQIAAEIDALTGQQAIQWTKVLFALAKYKDVNKALADGYIPVSGCEALPGLNHGQAFDAADTMLAHVRAFLAHVG